MRTMHFADGTGYEVAIDFTSETFSVWQKDQEVTFTMPITHRAQIQQQVWAWFEDLKSA